MALFFLARLRSACSREARALQAMKPRQPLQDPPSLNTPQQRSQGSPLLRPLLQALFQAVLRAISRAARASCAACALLCCSWLGLLPFAGAALAANNGGRPPAVASAAAGAAVPLVGPAGKPGVHYRFRLPTAATLVQPAHDLLSDEERRFLASLPAVRVALNLPDNRPYEVIGPDGVIAGVQIELLTHLALALGIRVEPVVLPSFTGALQALRERRVDMMATLGHDPSREAAVAFTLGTSPNPGAVIARAGAPILQPGSTLNGRRVAVERDYVVASYLRRAWPQAELVTVDTTADALQAVSARRADAYVGSLLMAMDVIQRDAIPGLEVSKTLVYGTGQMHFGVRKDWPLLASAFSKGIAALRAVPLPSTRAALQRLAALGDPALPVPLALSPAEQQVLAPHAVLRVGAVRGLALLNEFTAGGSHAGIASDYTHQVLNRLGVAATVVPFDSVAQMLDALRAGHIDLVPLLTYTPTRSREFHLSDAYLEMPYHIVARSDAPLYWGLDSLRGKRLALAAQHPLHEKLKAEFPDIQVLEAPPGPGAMDMVARGDADAAVEAKLYANLRILDEPNGRLRTTSQVDEVSTRFHFATGAAAAPLLPLVNRALADIGPDERARILRRWVATDYQPAWNWQRHLPWMLAIGGGLLLVAGASAWWMRRLALEVRSRRLAEERLQGLAASLPGVVFQYVADDDGKLRLHYVSPAVDEFFGVPDVARSGPLEVIAAQLSDTAATALQAARNHSLRHAQPFKDTLNWRPPGGPARWLQAEAVTHTLSDGHTAWTGCLVDVSGERALQAQLLDAVQTKNLFFASAGHELRGPLQVIGLAMQQLGQRRLDPQARELYLIAQDASATLVQLIDDLLDLARLEAGRMALHPAPVHLPSLLAQVVTNHRLVADARGLRLRTDLDPQLPGDVLLDALRLRQLLANLIGNALKYTPDGEVTLHARIQPAAAGEPPDRARLLLVVQDTGPGIAPERQSSLFEPFSGPGRPLAARNGGDRSTGLGLAICRRLVDVMQGQISLRSAAGQGTAVTVTLPLPPRATVALAAVNMMDVATETATGNTDADRPSEFSGDVVLLVDDDPVSRLLMGETLRQAGCQVDEAADPASAYARWRAGGVRLIISDQEMPGGDGLQLLQRVARESPPQQRPQLVLCSGNRLDIDPQQAGLDAVLRKPVTAEQLRRLAAQWVKPAATAP